MPYLPLPMWLTSIFPTSYDELYTHNEMVGHQRHKGGGMESNIWSSKSGYHSAGEKKRGDDNSL